MKLFNLEDTSHTGTFYSPSERYQAIKARSKASQAAKAKIKESLSKGHKLCTRCDTEQPLTNFDKDKKTYTGYSTWCKSCKKEHNKRYRQGTENIGETE